MTVSNFANKSSLIIVYISETANRDSINRTTKVIYKDLNYIYASIFITIILVSGYNHTGSSRSHVALMGGGGG